MPVMGKLMTMARKNNMCEDSVLFRVSSSCFWFRLHVFGPCCVHISLELHQSSFGSGPKPIFSSVSVHLFGVHQGSDCSVHTCSNEPH